MASSHRVTDLGGNPVRISKDEAPTPLSVQLGLCLFPPCYFIFLQPCQERGVSVFFVLFTLAFTTGWTSSGSLPFIGCFVLFSLFILVCFIICKNEKVLFVLVQYSSDFVASLGQGLELGQLPVLAIHCCRFSLGLPFFFFFSSYIVHLRCTSEWCSLDIYRDHSFFLYVGQFVSVCCPAVLLSLLSGLYRALTRVMCIQPLSRCSLML